MTDAITTPSRPEAITLNIELFTPELAHAALATQERNRPLSENWCDVLRRELVADHFQFTHQAIAFDRAGHLFDGQHRLQAIIRSGRSAWFVVVRGLDPDVMLATDRGRIKTLKDISYLTALCEDGQVVSVAGFLIEREYGLRGVTPIELRAFLAVHAEACAAAIALAPLKRGLITAAVQAAIARAQYSADHGRLKDFVELVRLAPDADDIAPEDSAALAFVRYVQRARGGKTGHAHPNRVLLYLHTLYALAHFVDRKPLKTTREGSGETFPIFPAVPELARAADAESERE